jgi:hypothetical protein
MYKTSMVSVSDFRIVIFNSILDGYTHKEVVENLIKDVKLNKQQAETFMTRTQTVIEDSVSKDLVWKYRKQLYASGVEFEIQPIASGLVDRKELSESEKVDIDLSETDVKLNKNMAKNFVLTDLSYEDVPVFRQRWFMALTLLLLTPVTLLICITGDVYAEIDGKVYKYSPFFKSVLTLITIVFLVNGFMMLK